MRGATSTPSIAAIDIGSNTIHLVVARPLADLTDLETLADETDLVRLGADVAATGAIGPERAARAVAEVRRQVARARHLGADPILGIATEGVRAASNGVDLLDRIHAEAGLEVRLVTGEQEAALTYWGATSGRVVAGGAVAGRAAVIDLGGGSTEMVIGEADRARAEAGLEVRLVTGEQEAALTYWGAMSGRALTGRALAGRAAVIDLGGGSTEMVIGEADRVAWRVSLPFGSGSLHDRVAPTDPADPAELDAVARLVEDALAPLAIPLPVAAAAACGGAATTLATLALRAGLAAGLPDHTAAHDAPAPDAPGAEAPHDRAPRNGDDPPDLTPARREALLGLLQLISAAAIARRYGVDEGRARLLAVGAVVLGVAARRLGVARLRVSRRGIREGAILAYLRHGAAWLDAAARG